MSENVPTQANEEIDLGFLFEKIKSFFKSILVGLVRIIQFFWKHKFPLIGVGVVGIAVGLYMAKTSERIYLNELLVKPNYKSTQYLYDKVDAVNFKIDNKDSIFLKDIFGDYYNKVKGIEVEPIVDVYNLIGESKESRETFEEIFADNADEAFFEAEINKLAYTNHKVKLLLKGDEWNEKLSLAFLDHLNSNTFYNEQKDIILKKKAEILAENKFMRDQIDSIIKSVKKESMPAFTNEGLSFSGSQNVTELIIKRANLLDDDLVLLSSLASDKKVVSLLAMNNGILNHSYNFAYRIIPVYFILVYCLIFLLIHTYKKLARYA